MANPSGIPSTAIALPQSHGIAKRDLGIGTMFATYAVASTVINKIVDHFWPHKADQELEMRTEETRKLLDHMVATVNASVLQSQAIQDALITQANLIHHNAAEIHHIAMVHPQLMVVTAHLVSQLVVTGAQIESLYVDFRNRKPNFNLISV